MRHGITFKKECTCQKVPLKFVDPFVGICFVLNCPRVLFALFASHSSLCSSQFVSHHYEGSRRFVSPFI